MDNSVFHNECPKHIFFLHPEEIHFMRVIQMQNPGILKYVGIKWKQAGLHWATLGISYASSYEQWTDIHKWI